MFSLQTVPVEYYLLIFLIQDMKNIQLISKSAVT